MPWISRTNRSTHRNSHTGYWLLALTAAVLLGILIGYQQWGTTAAVVSLVEREMAITQAQLKTFEKRLGAMELKFASSNLSNSTGAIANVQLEQGSHETQGALLKNQITRSTAEQQ
jgi:hypothetical protein